MAALNPEGHKATFTVHSNYSKPGRSGSDSVESGHNEPPTKRRKPAPLDIDHVRALPHQPTPYPRNECDLRRIVTPPPVSERSSQSSSLQSAFESPVTTQTTSAQAKERLLRQFGDRLNSQAMLEVYKQICDYGEAVRREAWDQFHEKIALIRYDSGSLGDATVD